MPRASQSGSASDAHTLVGIPWSPAEDVLLKAAVAKYGEADRWKDVALDVPGRTNKSCRKRWLHSLSPSIKKSMWTSDEDALLISLHQVYGQRWALIARKIEGRTDDACSKRYRDALDPSLNHGAWTDEEDQRLVEANARHGEKWVTIGQDLNRSSLGCRNRWRLLQRNKMGKRSTPPTIPEFPQAPQFEWDSTWDSLPLYPSQPVASGSGWSHWSGMETETEAPLLTPQLTPDFPYNPLHPSPGSSSDYSLPEMRFHQDASSPTGSLTSLYQQSPPSSFNTFYSGPYMAYEEPPYPAGPGYSPFYFHSQDTSLPLLEGPTPAEPERIEYEDQSMPDITVASPLDDLDPAFVPSLIPKQRFYNLPLSSSSSLANALAEPVPLQRASISPLSPPPSELESILEDIITEDPSPTVSSLNPPPPLELPLALSVLFSDSPYYREHVKSSSLPAPPPLRTRPKAHTVSKNQQATRLSGTLPVSADPNIKPYVCGHPLCFIPGATESKSCFRICQELSEHSKTVHDNDLGGREPFRCGLSGCIKTWRSLQGLQYHLQVSKVHFRDAVLSSASASSPTAPAPARTFALPTLVDLYVDTVGGEGSGGTEGEGEGSKSPEPVVLTLYGKPKKPAKVHACPQCGKEYKQLSGLRYHLAHGHIDEGSGELQLEKLPPTLERRLRSRTARN